MSSINSIGSSLSQYFQNLSAAGQTATAQPSSVSSTDPSTDSTSTGQAVQGAGHHKHHGGGKFKQIEQAVTSALQSAQSTNADGTPTDVNQTIQDAISKVLNGNATSNAATTDPTATTQTSPTTAPDSIQDFLQTLSAAGVDPQQFRQDFLSAVQNSTNGQADPTGSSSLLPPGSLVDVEG